MTESPSPQPISSILIGRPWLLPTITGVVGLIVGGVLVGVAGVVAAAVVGAGSPPVAARLADALDTCNVNDSDNAELADAGKTVTVNMRGDEDFEGLTYDQAMCIVESMDPPAAVVSHIEQTTSLDGRQTETWDDVTISWSYHPDRGFDYVLTIDEG